MAPRQRQREGGVNERVVSVPKGGVPLLVCGLPGSGYVGKLAADHLVSSFGARMVAEYSCDSFPPQVNVGEDGTAKPLSAAVFHAQGKKGKGFLVFTADAQPTTSQGEYELSDAVIGFARRCGVKRVYTLAAYITGAFSAESKVYGAGTSRKMLEELQEKGVRLMKDGGISGMNGLIIGIAALRGLEGACLLGETSGYVVDAGASKAVLEMLSGLSGIPVDLSKLKEKAEETKKVIGQLQSMSEQSQEAAAPPRREEKPGYIA